MNKLILKSLDIPDKLEIKQWLEELAETHNLRFLLAHAEDGVIWGEFRDGKLVTSDSAFSYLPKLRLLTLQQCRAFGTNAEVMLWQSDEGLNGRFIEDKHITKEDYIPENQILWGTQADEVSNGFTLVSDGSQGLRHAVPLTNINFDKSQKLHRPLRLSVRHYVTTDEQTGIARIYLSRLVKLY
ncbi:CRISPR-associated protein [Dulcicalothrix desertica PCC 7102]|uniref:CRISPR-associated protein n=1 Tax=Dulcicalothrix desertica PCC 7102 TaxID=232991 RepID=A0A433UXM4_9CYAN|nr:CRISPR-associated protein Csx19 [Dulcicalothrix desertica]RUS98583.1 CRISPR-associated protein [Dulcicalothrix desertica PCC 7102]TWH43090.1 CRISPR-associated protein (TIGR03984 family) [Dulcicalothrix desertica PCC 7102]